MDLDTWAYSSLKGIWQATPGGDKFLKVVVLALTGSGKGFELI